MLGIVKLEILLSQNSLPCQYPRSNPLLVPSTCIDFLSSLIFFHCIALKLVDLVQSHASYKNLNNSSPSFLSFPIQNKLVAFCTVSRTAEVNEVYPTITRSCSFTISQHPNCELLQSLSGPISIFINHVSQGLKSHQMTFLKKSTQTGTSLILLICVIK